ncbi:CHAT domain-containing protein [Nostoc parmelioides]|uniref:CHAT domain-containing protein n=1 Tax=Nostoc parmelioides FACHB-3921 TaxID=2692909 RepID=A0ABR8BNK6_9NOSO|nr:CHAT domain-containing protein [Nostoc parmelioides]MBD2255365.1 CHAT domain-containing protein [Nostoc parmelioides FACHB-3921]
MSSNGQIKILFLAADPSDNGRLRLGQELRDIREKLQLAKDRDQFVLESRESVSPGDISQAIFDVEPDIVHFSGHGDSTGELSFEDLLGQTQPVDPDALAALFELVADKINCVVLNACYSETQAQAIADHIPYVIGMSTAIGDKAAIAFAVGFYKAIAAGRTIDQAYKFGCVEIRLQGIPEHLTPVLYTKVRSNEVKPTLPQRNSSSVSLTPGQRRRTLQEINSLQQQYDLLSEKLSHLRLNLAIESSTTVQFNLKKQIEQLETEVKEISQRIENLENKL